MVTSSRRRCVVGGVIMGLVGRGCWFFLGAGGANAETATTKSTEIREKPAAERRAKAEPGVSGVKVLL